MSAAPPSVPPSSWTLRIEDGCERLVMLSVPPVNVSASSLSRLAIDVTPELNCTSVSDVSGMQTRSAGPGTPSGFQFAASCQELVPAPPSQVFVAELPQIGIPRGCAASAGT